MTPPLRRHHQFRNWSPLSTQNKIHTIPVSEYFASRGDSYTQLVPCCQYSFPIEDFHIVHGLTTFADKAFCWFQKGNSFTWSGQKPLLDASFKSQTSSARSALVPFLRRTHWLNPFQKGVSQVLWDGATLPWSSFVLMLSSSTWGRKLIFSPYYPFVMCLLLLCHVGARAFFGKWVARITNQKDSSSQGHFPDAKVCLHEEGVAPLFVMSWECSYVLDLSDHRYSEYGEIWHIKKRVQKGVGSWKFKSDALIVRPQAWATMLLEFLFWFEEDLLFKPLVQNCHWISENLPMCEWKQNVADCIEVHNSGCNPIMNECLSTPKNCLFSAPFGCFRWWTLANSWNESRLLQFRLSNLLSRTRKPLRYPQFWWPLHSMIPLGQ